MFTSSVYLKPIEMYSAAGIHNSLILYSMRSDFHLLMFLFTSWCIICISMLPENEEKEKHFLVG